MVVSKENQTRCNHCGGILTVSAEESTTCLMCGRPSAHKCEMCFSIHEKKPVAEKKPAKKRARKRVGASK